jgi:hypothetical protein
MGFGKPLVMVTKLNTSCPRVVIVFIFVSNFMRIFNVDAVPWSWIEDKRSHFASVNLQSNKKID